MDRKEEAIMAIELRSGVTEIIEITDDMISTLVTTGGYPHPLFQEGWREIGMRGRPLPGQAVLLLVGGAMERTGKFDHAIALLGVDDVNFLNAVVAGDSIRLEWEEIEFLPWKSAGRELLRMKWRVLNQFDELCMEASSRMLVRVIAK
jgi:acyl dehydratase